MYDIPFASWSIEPIGYSRAVLVIAGERRWSVGEKEIEIVIDEVCMRARNYSGMS